MKTLKTIDIELPLHMPNGDVDYESFEVEVEFNIDAGDHFVECSGWELQARFQPTDEQTYYIDRAIEDYIAKNYMQLIIEDVEARAETIYEHFRERMWELKEE